MRRYVAPFFAGVAVGVALHEYWPRIRGAGGPRLERVVARVRRSFWEQREKFSDLVAEIREEEEAASRPPPAT